MGPKLEVRFNHKLPCPSKAGMPRWKRLPNKPLEWAKSNKALDSASAASVCVCVWHKRATPEQVQLLLPTIGFALPSTILAVATSTMRLVRLGLAILLYLLSLAANPGVNSFNPSESLLQEQANIFSLQLFFVHAARAIAFSCNTETSCNSQLAVVLPA